ncbi:hypothetical protein F5B19DRAFT_475383 [Rostrohypoxylon terebratum]|nr:hypothetical protein F5B19DRAFT_475383 [Rostrohypoxylon terebratum]
MHEKDASHPLACICGKVFSRSDALLRHLRPYSNGRPKHTCIKCGKSFWRSDKLQDHVSKGCPGGRVKADSDERMNEATPIATTSSLSISMSGGANPLKLGQFPCAVAGCDRVDNNGFVQLTDLIEHLATVHLDQEQRHGVCSALQQTGASQSFQPNVITQSYQPISGTQPYGQDNTLWPYEQDYTFQQFQWSGNYLQPFEQDGASQYFQPDATAQALDSEPAFENPERDNIFYFDQQNGFY